jgi:3',5'-cyclic AMP phosphodiesterase CpdA
MRLAFATDTHVQPERKAGEGWAACLRHIHEQKDRPELIMTGGDLVMSSFGATPERTQTQWEVFTRVIEENCTLPIRHVIGNHDVFGWGNRDKYSTHPRFGKTWACELLGLEKPYYSFDRAGWHFIVLDSTYPAGNSYTARLDDEQFEWLQSDLAGTPKTTPVVIASHIPILMVCAIFDGENEKTGDWVIPGSYMHIDARRIVELFLKHPNVKLCLGGHEHQVDHVIYNGVSYMSCGAVSGGWWAGNHFQCTYGYKLVDLFADGTFEASYVHYGWQTVSQIVSERCVLQKELNAFE